MARIAQSKALTPEEQAIKEAEDASREYLLAKKEADRAAATVKVLRDIMFEKLEKAGEADENGHVKFSLPTPYFGTAALVKQRRVSRKIDEAKAREIAEEHDLLDTLIKTVEVFDEDAIMQALVNEELTPDEVDAMFPATVTYALTAEKEKSA